MDSNPECCSRSNLGQQLTLQNKLALWKGFSGPDSHRLLGSFERGPSHQQGSPEDLCGRCPPSPPGEGDFLAPGCPRLRTVTRPARAAVSGVSEPGRPRSAGGARPGTSPAAAAASPDLPARPGGAVSRDRSALAPGAAPPTPRARTLAGVVWGRGGPWAGRGPGGSETFDRRLR